MTLPDILKYADVNGIKHTNKRMLFAEADGEIDTTEKPGIKAMAMRVVGSIFSKLNTRVMALTNGRAGYANLVNADMTSILDTYGASTMKMATGLDKSFAMKSRRLKDLESFIDEYKKIVSFRRDISKSDASSKGGMLTIIQWSMFAYCVESLAIIAEGTTLAYKGEIEGYDEYIESNKMYKKVFDNLEIISKEGADITALYKTLYKESFDDYRNQQFYLEAAQPIKDVIEMYSETDLDVSLATVIKAQMFKTLYAVMGPVRWIVYMFSYAKYSIKDRIDQIKETLVLYTEKNIQDRPTREAKLMSNISTAKSDRLKADSEAESDISKDGGDVSADINKGNYEV